jgi:organic radical activating enzyme
MQDQDYYCNVKFKSLKLDIEKKQSYNCCEARSHTIDVKFLKKNPGQLFNTEINVFERQQMLRNERNASCEHNCWRSEDAGKISPRILFGGDKKTHSDVYARPESLELTLGSDCNLQCTYCCKEFSSAWRRDLKNNGEYVGVGPDRYSLTRFDELLLKVSQKEKLTTDYYQTLLNELVELSSTAKKVRITGGEPLLDNNLLEVLQSVVGVNSVEIFTGLGVNFNRFQKLIEKIATFKNVSMIVSVENINEYYEFNRNGMKWDDAERKINFLIDNKMCSRLHSVLSNLTIFGFLDFYNKYSQLENTTEITKFFAYTPEFMSVHVMDQTSKDKILSEIDASNLADKDLIIQNLSIVPTHQQQLQFKNFITQYLKRHPGLNMEIFPRSFRDWIENI